MRCQLCPIKAHSLSLHTGTYTNNPELKWYWFSKRLSPWSSINIVEQKVITTSGVRRKTSSRSKRMPQGRTSLSEQGGKRPSPAGKIYRGPQASRSRRH
jgi:hypothetical protein